MKDRPIVRHPGLYAGADCNLAVTNLVRGGAYVVSHHEAGALLKELHPKPIDAAEYLWSFVGTVGNHPIRRRLQDIADNRALFRDTQRWSDVVRWKREDELYDEAQALFKSYGRSLRESKFVVCPRGVGHSTMRIFETMQVGRCPVIISDRWLPPAGVAWESVAIRVAETKIDTLPDLLREMEGEAEARGGGARLEWERCFADHRLLEYVVRNAWQIQSARKRGDAARLRFRSLCTGNMVSELRQLGRKRIGHVLGR